MLKYFKPDLKFASFGDISPAALAARGIKGVIIDIDNTLVSHNHLRPTREAKAFIEGLAAAGFLICLVSNNNKARVSSFNSELGLNVFHRAGKPLKRAFKKAMRAMNTLPGETAIIGDQIFTDIWGGKRTGIHTILVDPVSPSGEGFFIKIKRRLEGRILGDLKK